MIVNCKLSAASTIILRPETKITVLMLPSTIGELGLNFSKKKNTMPYNTYVRSPADMSEVSEYSGIGARYRLAVALDDTKITMCKRKPKKEVMIAEETGR